MRQASSSAFSGGPKYLENAGGSGDRLGTIKFDTARVDPQLTAAKQNEFKIDFCEQMARLEKWAADRHWVAFPVRVPEFHVIVSDRYKISKSLVPAWSGRAGDMEFPLWRVAARQAAITHELVHVFFPNGNRFLAEGLAVYLQAEIGGNPAFPNFGRPLHWLVREMVPGFSSGSPEGLELIRLTDLDKIATPNPLSLRIGQDFYGEDPRGQARIYPLAGSFVQFLIESRGSDAFHKIYMRTPLVPLQQNPGTPDRWTDVYGHSLVRLEDEWKSLIAKYGELTIE